MLSSIVLMSCSADPGDLFPEVVAEPPAATPALTLPEGASERGQPPRTPEGASAIAPDPPPSEAAPAPVARDDGAGEGAAAPGPPLVSSDDEPVEDELGPAPAPPPVEPQPAEPPTNAGDSAGVRVCGGVESPLLLDFEAVDSDPAQALFGDFRAVLSGGTFVYPSVQPSVGEVARGLVSDVMSGDWHISGSVIEQAGFGLFFDCQLLDASGFLGLAFRIAGSVGGAGSVTLLVGSASNDVSSAWLAANGGTSSPSAGRCIPAQNEYDGTCDRARIEIPVSNSPREIVVPFSALAGGSPEAGVNPAEITSISWALPGPSVDAFGNPDPYPVNLRIDDIRFVEAAAQP